MIPEVARGLGEAGPPVPARPSVAGRGVSAGIGDIAVGAGGTLATVRELTRTRPLMEYTRRALGAEEQPFQYLRGALRGGRERERPYQLGEYLIRRGQEIQQEYAPEGEAAQTFNPKSLDWWAYNLGRQGPQFLAALGLAAVSGPAAVAGFAAPAFVLEGGMSYAEAVRNGATPEEAAGAAFLTGTVASALDAIPGGVIFLNRFPGARQVFQKGVLSRIGARGVASATAEGLTEAAQEAWADVVAYTANTDPDAFADFVQRYAASSAVGAVLGAGTGATIGGEAPIPRPELGRPLPRAAPAEAVTAPPGRRPEIEVPPPAAPPEATVLPSAPPTVPPEAPPEAVAPPPAAPAAPPEEVPAAVPPDVLPPDAPAGSVGMFPTARIRTDPARFQYKEVGIGERGVSRALEGVEQWDPNKGGVVLVWRDPADGETYVVNGHHRLALAEDRGVENIAVRFIDAANANEALMIGAATNIAEGAGSPIDVAKLVRRQGLTAEDMAEMNVPPRSALARDGLALANLAPAIFDRVVREELPVVRAAVIGRSGLDQEQQLALVDMLGRQRREPTNAQLEELIRFVRGAGEIETTQESLFGAETLRRSLALEKAQLSAELKRLIGQDRRLFGYLARGGRGKRIRQAQAGTVDVRRAAELATEAGQIEEVYNRLSTMSGPLNEALTEGARQVAEGRSPKDVATEVRPAITRAIEAELARLSGEPPAAEPAAGPRGRREPEGRPAGEEGSAAEAPLAEPLDLFGGEGEPGARQEELFGGRQRLAEAEANARETVARLGRQLEANALTSAQLEQLREALALLNRSGRMTAQELAIRARIEQQQRRGRPRPETEGGVLLEPSEGAPPPARAPNFTTPPSGRAAYGEIDEETATVLRGRAPDLRVQAAPIQLTRQRARHIWREHGHELRRAGYDSAEAFVEDAANRVTEIRRGLGGSLVLIAPTGQGKTRVAYVTLHPEAGGYWGVGSAHLMAGRDVQKWRLLWEAARDASTGPGLSGSRATGSIRPGEPGGQSGIVSGGPQQPEGDIPVPGPEVARRATRAAVLADADVIDTDAESVPHEARIDPPPDELDPNPEAALERIGDRIAGNLATPEGRRPGRGVDAPKVVREIAKIAAVAGKPIPIRVGRLGRYARRARGLFFPQTLVIRINRANNIATAAHELGQGLERILYGNPEGSPWKKPLVGAAVQRELARLGRELYGDTQPAGGYKREGWAEYVRTWITQTNLDGKFLSDADIKDLAPQLTAWFDGAFSEQFPDVRRQFEAARAAAREWAEQGAMERARQSMVDVAAPRERARGFVESVKGVVTIEKWIEMARPFGQVARAAEAQLGRKLAPEEDPYALITALRTTHAARTRQMVETGMIDIAGNQAGPALAEIRELVRGRQEDFTIYLWAKRALALGPARPAGLSLEDAAYIVQELDSPKFQQAAGKVYDWNNGVLDYAAQASPTFRDVVERVRAVDPGNYVPLQRVFDELDRTAAAMPKGGPTRTSPVKRLKGSGRRIKEPFSVMIANAEATVRRAHERGVMDATIKLANVPGMGAYINEIPPDRVPAYTASFGKLLNELETALGTAGISVRLEDAVSGEDPNTLQLANLLGETVTFFTDAQRAPSGEIIYPVWSNGRVRWFEVDPELFGALSAMDVYRMSPTMEFFFGKPAAALRAGTTGLRASFSLITNPARDVQSLWVNSRSGKWGGRLFAEWMRGLKDMALAKTPAQRSAWAAQYMQLGLEMSQSLGQDIPHTRLAARKLFQGRVARTLTPRNMFEFYRELIQTPEAAPRLAEFRLAAKEVGWEPGQPMTLSQSLQLMIAAKQVTTDFTAAGEYGRMVNRIVPFHNASIQGPRAHIRAARDHPVRFAARGMQLALATLALWWIYRDEEWYTQLEPWERFGFWHLPFDNPFTGQREMLRIPRAFEVGQIFASLPEVLVDAWYRDEPREVEEWFSEFWKTIRPPSVRVVRPGGVPLPIPEAPLGEVVAEQLANRRFYFDAPIETRAEQLRAPEERYSEYTSRVAIWLGNEFNVSPKRIDHAIKGFFGPVGGDILGAIELGPKGTERERELADLPVAGRLFRRGGQVGTSPRSVDQMYDALEQAHYRQYSRENPENPLERQQRLQLEDAARAVSSLFYIRQNVPDPAKRERITRAIARLTAEAVQLHGERPASVEELEKRRARFRSIRRQAEQLEEAVRGGR